MNLTASEDTFHRKRATITDLAVIMVMERDGFGHNLRLLERDNLFKTAPGNDRRSRHISLTAKGRRRLNEARPYWQTAQRQLTQTGTFNGLRPLLLALARDGLNAR